MCSFQVRDQSKQRRLRGFYKNAELFFFVTINTLKFLIDALKKPQMVAVGTQWKLTALCNLGPFESHCVTLSFKWISPLYQYSYHCVHCDHKELFKLSLQPYGICLSRQIAYEMGFRSGEVSFFSKKKRKHRLWDMTASCTPINPGLCLHTNSFSNFTLSPASSRQILHSYLI